MLIDEAGAATTPVVEGQNPSQVSTDEKSVETLIPPVSEDAKTQEKVVEAKEDAAKTSKPEPFHKHPAFQRMTRKNAKLAAQNEALTGQVSEMSSLMKEVIALQKGEEFKAEPKAAEVIPDAQDLLDMEMEKLLESEDLSSEEEANVMSIAKKYKTDIGDNQSVFLPAATALQILRDSTAVSGKEKRVVSTKPSSGASEANVGEGGNKQKHAKTLAEAIWRAKQDIAKRQGAVL